MDWATINQMYDDGLITLQEAEWKAYDIPNDSERDLALAEIEAARAAGME